MSQGAPVKIGIAPGSGGLGREPEEITLSRDDRLTHTYVCGVTRQGKSKLLESMIRQDIIANRTSGSGLLVLDPHAALVKPTLRWMARYGLLRPIMVIDLGRDDWVVGISPLRRSADDDIDEVASRLVESIAHVWGSATTTDTPLFHQWAFNIAYALVHKGMTLAEAGVFTSPGRLPEKRWLTAGLPDETVAGDWKRALALKDLDYAREIGSTARRIGSILKSKRLLRMLGQAETIDWRRAMDEGWIVFLAFSSSTDVASTTLATMVLTSLWHAASQRDKERKPSRFHVYLDEFERFVTPAMAQSLAEAAGFGLALTMSHQFPHQLRHSGPHGARLLDEVFNNARTKITFNVGHESGKMLGREFSVDPALITSLPKRRFVVKAATWLEAKVVDTTDVPVAAISDDELTAWIDAQMATWREPFIMSRQKAEANLDGRLERAMRDDVRGNVHASADECVTSRRPVRRSTPK